MSEGVGRQIKIRPEFFSSQKLGGVVSTSTIVASGLLIFGFFIGSGVTLAAQKEGTLGAAFSSADGAVEALSSLESAEEYLI